MREFANEELVDKEYFVMLTTPDFWNTHSQSSDGLENIGYKLDSTSSMVQQFVSAVSSTTKI